MTLNKTKKRIILFILTIILIFGISLVYIKLEYITRKQVKTIISEDLGVKKEMLDNYNINLKRKNKKFIYGLVREGGRAREYEAAIILIK